MNSSETGKKDDGKSPFEKHRLMEAQAAGLKTVLLVCSGNAVRSQMAEALVNHFLKRRWAAFSAGVSPAALNPWVVRVLREVGIEDLPRRSKSLEIFLDCHFDWVITLCSAADTVCTYFPGLGRQVHIPFQDPMSVSPLGFGWASLFRKLRDEMRERLIPLLESWE